jgi:hypothetical protein
MVFCWPESVLSQHVSDFCVLLFLHHTDYHPGNERKIVNISSSNHFKTIFPLKESDIQ